MPMNDPTPTIRDALRDLVVACVTALCAVAMYLFIWWDNPDAMLWDDLQTQYLPVAIEVGRALRAHEWPLLTTRSWFGGALAGEYQYGVFSPVELACAWLVAGFERAPSERAALLCALHVVILASGAYALARVRGTGRAAACWVSLAASLNGWMVGWALTNWYPAYTSFAWIPWSWAALERLRRPEATGRAVSLAALPMALVFLAGWPFSVAMLVFIAAYVIGGGAAGLARRVLARRVGVALALAAGLAAPAWWSLVSHGAATLRATDPNRLGVLWLVPWNAWPGMVIPSWPTLWRTYTNWTLAPSPWLFNGLVPLAGVVAGLRAQGRSFVAAHRAEFFALAALFALVSLPTVRPLQVSSRWLPLLHLVIALVGAEGVAAAAQRATDAGPIRSLRDLATRLWSPRNVGMAALLVVAPVCFVMLTPGMSPVRIVSGVSGVVALALLWALAGLVVDARSLPARVAPVAVVALSLVSTALTVPLRVSMPRWSIEASVADPRPMERSRRYFMLYNRADVFSNECCDLVGHGRFAGVRGELLPGNFGLYAGLTTLNGYSPLRLRTLQRAFDLGIHGYTIRPRLMPVLERHVGAGRLLDLAGVDGLVLPERLAARFTQAEAQGWRVAGTRPGVTVYHRDLVRAPVVSLAEARTVRSFDEAARALEAAPDAPPVFFDTRASGSAERFAEARLDRAREERNATTVDVAVPADHDALLVFARAWYPGFTADLDGRALDVGTADLILPAVRVPAGSSGRLVLAYRPASVRYGPFVSVLSLVALVALAAGVRRKK